MTALRCADCRCTHSKADHDTPGFNGQCTARACTCLTYRPNLATATNPGPPPIHRPPATPAPAQASTPSGSEALIAAGKRSTVKRTAALAAKIEAQLLDLHARLRDEQAATEAARRAEQEKAEARRQIELLEAQLAEAKAKLQGKAGHKPAAKEPAPAPRTRSPLSCSFPGCDRTFESGQAVAMHRRRAHEGFDPRATA